MPNPQILTVKYSTQCETVATSSWDSVTSFTIPRVRRFHTATYKLSVLFRDLTDSRRRNDSLGGNGRRTFIGPLLEDDVILDLDHDRYTKGGYARVDIAKHHLELPFLGRVSGNGSPPVIVL